MANDQTPKSLVSRFLAGAEARLTQLGEVAGRLAESREKDELVKKLARELHSLKGESRLLGLPELERITHATEDLLHDHHTRAVISPATEALLFEAIDELFACVDARIEGKEIAEADISELVERLRGAGQRSAPAAPAGVITAVAPTASAGGEATGAERAAGVGAGGVGAGGVGAGGEGAGGVGAGGVGAGGVGTGGVGAGGEGAGGVGGVGGVGAGGVGTGGATATEVESRGVGRCLQVDVSLLDRITDLVSDVSGRLVRNKQYVARTLGLVNTLREALSAYRGPSSEAHDTRAFRGSDTGSRGASVAALVAELQTVVRELHEHSYRLGVTHSELTDKMRECRLQPLSTIFASYPAFVRRCAREQKKLIRIEVGGEEVGVEQRMLEEIGEPCLHLLRNAVSHGIETPEERRAAGKPEEGLISICAQQDGDLIRIEIADDGRGIDTGKILRRALAMGVVTKAQAEQLDEHGIAKLMFTSGLSTATETDEMSGRGVGLDVVNNVVDRMGGTIAFDSQRGKGSSFVLQVPVSLSLTRALLFESCDQMFAIPNAAVVEVFRLAAKEIRTIDGHEATTFRGRALPLTRLRDALGLKGLKDIFVNNLSVMVIRAGEEKAGFIVDRFFGEREVLIRPFPPFLGRPAMTTGVTLREDGEVVLILHAPDLLRFVHHKGRGRRERAATETQTSSAHRVLLVEDSMITREYAAGVLRARGFATTEAGDGIEALACLERGRFDIILTDLQMPRMDGFKLCATIRKDSRYKHIPIVVLSTIDTPEAKRMALDAGADAYVVKSGFTADLLVNTLLQFTRGAT